MAKSTILLSRSFLSYGHHYQLRPLNYWYCKSEVSSPCRLEYMSQMYPNRPYYNFTACAMKHSHLCCTRKSIYLPFLPSMWPRPPSQWASWLPKRLKECNSQWKMMTRQVFLKIVSTHSRQKKFLGTFLCAAAAIAYLQLWYRLVIMDSQCTCSYMADLFEPWLGKYSLLEATKQIFV